MEKIPYTNDTAAPVYVGGLLVKPGQTRMIDPADAPNYAAALAAGQATAAGEPENPTLKLLDRPVKDILPELPALTDAQLDELEAGEADGKTRKGVLEAIAEQRVLRAEESLALENIANATPEQLQAVVEGQDGRDHSHAFIAAVKVEIERRANAAPGA
jgi:hypothetical protein